MQLQENGLSLAPHRGVDVPLSGSSRCVQPPALVRIGLDADDVGTRPQGFNSRVEPSGAANVETDQAGVSCLEQS